MTGDRYREQHAAQPPSFRKIEPADKPVTDLRGAAHAGVDWMRTEIERLTGELAEARAQAQPPMSAFGPFAMRHELKIWPQYFELVISGLKRFEIRRNDRPFRLGDLLNLREYEATQSRYTGRTAQVEVLYLTSDTTLCLPGFVVMSIRLIALGARSCG